jgi:hypothetical protein
LYYIYARFFLKEKEMNTNQENKLSMWLVLRDYLLENTSITDKLPGYASWLGRLRDCIDNVMKSTDMQAAEAKGLTIRKNKLEEDLMLKLLEVAAKVRAYAVMNDDLIVEARFKLSMRKLRNLADTLLIAKAQGLLNSAREVQAAASAYGVSQELLDSSQELTDAYTQAVPQPREGIDNRKQQTRAMAAEFKKGDEVLKGLDVLMGVVRYEEPMFYLGYRRARKITNTARRTRAMQLWVKDSAKGKPVVLAKVFLKTTAGEAVLKKPRKTGKSGSVIMRHMAPGEYTYEVVMGGFVSENGKFYINRGEMTRVVVMLRGVKNLV